MRRHWVVALAALAAIGTTTPAAAQRPDIIRTQLDSAVSMMRGQGFAAQGSYRTGALAARETQTLRVDLQGGRSYIIVGVCDADCSDLDLALSDADGNEVDTDYEMDDVPMVSAQPTRNGTFELTVSMAACSVAPCAWGVVVVATGGSLMSERDDRVEAGRFPSRAEAEEDADRGGHGNRRDHRLDRQ